MKKLDVLFFIETDENGKESPLCVFPAEGCPLYAFPFPKRNDWMLECLAVEGFTKCSFGYLANEDGSLPARPCADDRKSLVRKWLLSCLHDDVQLEVGDAKRFIESNGEDW